MMYTSESLKKLNSNKIRFKMREAMYKTAEELENLLSGDAKQNSSSINDLNLNNDKDKRTIKNPADTEQENKIKKPIFTILNNEIRHGSNVINKSNTAQADKKLEDKDKSYNDEFYSKQSDTNNPLLDKKTKCYSNNANGSNTNLEDAKEQ